MTRVAITALSVASPIGNLLADFSEQLFAGKSGVTNIRGVTVPHKFPVPYAGLLQSPKGYNFQIPTEVITHLVETLCCNIQERLTIDGIILGTGEGLDFNAVERHLRDPQNISFLDQLRSQHCLEIIYKILNSKLSCQIPIADQISIYNACASGNVAIGTAFEKIRSGRWTRAIAGSFDLRTSAPYLMSFHLLNALTTAEVPPQCASRPFTRSRSGFVKSEGGALLILESHKAALERGAEIMGFVEGYGISSDGFRITDGRDDCKGAIRAIEMALKSAQILPSQVDYINAHGTSTLLNDLLETRAIRMVFGKDADRIPVSSIKSQIGHAAVGCGALEAVACALILKRQLISPTINYDDPDPDCDLDYVPNHSRQAKVNTILSNSFGFGGQNACLIFKKAE